MRDTIACILLGSALAACGGGSGDGKGFEDRQIINDYADAVVVPTYQLLAERAAALEAAVNTLVDDLTEANLAAAQQAWVAAREPWEQSEAFLFGPVAANGYDPAMDSWPVNRTDLEAVLASGDPLTPEYVQSLPDTQKGFHTIEYLLFGPNSAKTTGEFTVREFEYLAATAAELRRITNLLATSWTAGDPSYRDVFATAGEPDNTTYPSLESAAQEILVGMSGICDEVANGKIADPYDARDPNLVESQFSFNSLIDFGNNMRSVLNSYTGDFPAGQTDGRGLADLVAERDAALDERLRAEIQAAIGAIDAIPPPFRDAIQDSANDAAIEAAQEAIRTVQTTIDQDLTAVVLE